jgi:hypothetical protein
MIVLADRNSAIQALIVAVSAAHADRRYRQPCLCTRGMSHRKTARSAQGQEGLTQTMRQVSKEKEGVFFLVSSLRATQVPALADHASGALGREGANPNWCAARPLLCFAAVQAPEPWFGFSNYFFDLLSYAYQALCGPKAQVIEDHPHNADERAVAVWR